MLGVMCYGWNRRNVEGGDDEEAVPFANGLALIDTPAAASLDLRLNAVFE